MDKITKAGDVLVEALEIITSQNKTVDIRAQLVELNLFEDLYTDVLSGTVMVQDSFNFIINLPLIGEEQIHVRFRTPSLKSKDVIDRTFTIYKIGEKIVKDRSLVYQIYFTSNEAIIDSNRAVSRSMGGKISNLIQDVLRQPLFLGTPKELKIEQTTNSVQFIPAYWSPFKIVSYLTKRALNSAGNPGFLFYETNKNFVFASTDTLLSQQPLTKYVYSESSARDYVGTDFEAMYSKILMIRSDTVFDYLDRLRSGMYASKITLINPINKNVEVKNIDYLSNFDKHKHLSQYPLASKNVVASKQSNLFFEEYAPFVYDTKMTRATQWKTQRRMLMSELNAIKFEIEVHGRTDIEVGKVVSLQLPSFTAIREGDRAKDVNDTYYNGNYLVTAINHRVNLTSHRMVMEVVKDTYSKSVEKSS